MSSLNKSSFIKPQKKQRLQERNILKNLKKQQRLQGRNILKKQNKNINRQKQRKKQQQSLIQER